MKLIIGIMIVGAIFSGVFWYGQGDKKHVENIASQQVVKTTHNSTEKSTSANNGNSKNGSGDSNGTQKFFSNQSLNNFSSAASGFLASASDVSISAANVVKDDALNVYAASVEMVKNIPKLKDQVVTGLVKKAIEGNPALLKEIGVSCKTSK